MAIELPFVCPHCGAKSWHPKDAEERYCGRCHRFVDDPEVDGTNIAILAVVTARGPLDAAGVHGEYLARSARPIDLDSVRGRLDRLARAGYLVADGSGAYALAAPPPATPPPPGR